MNLIKLLYISLIIILCPTLGYAQKKTLTLEMSNAPLSDILIKIEKNTGYYFQYSKQVIDVRQKRTLKVKNQPIEVAMDSLLKGTNIRYQIKKKQIILNNIKEKEKKEIKKILNTTKGIVLDSKSREPIIGASITMEGEQKGTISNTDGCFEIETPEDSRIKISYIGYLTQLVTPQKNGTLEVLLSENTQMIDEIVVVGYGSMAIRNLPNAIAQVKPDKIPQTSISNVNQLFVGRAAGMQALITSTQPDGKVNVSIRGGDNPIFVVDGVVMPNESIATNGGETGLPSNVNRSGLAGINPMDIESIEVLKDASAAIYGISAANGVILITTKKGKEGAPSITYDGNFSFVWNCPYLDVLDTQEYMDMANIFSKENYLYNKKQYPYGSSSYDGKWTSLFSESDKTNATTTNWKDYVLNQGYITKHNITVSGGTSKFKYYLGGGYLDQDGTVSKSSMTKYTFRGNLTLELFPFLNLSSSFSANQNIYNNSMVGTDTGNRGNVAGSALNSALLYPPYLSLKQKDDTYTIFKSIPNPKAMEAINDKTKEHGYNLNFTANLKLYKDMLYLKGIYGMNQENMRRSIFIPSNVYFSRMYKSRGNIQSERRLTQTLEVMLMFSRQMFDIVHVDALAGMGKYLESSEGYGISYEDVHDAINEHDISSAEGKIYPTSHTQKNERRSQFFKVGFDILDKYVVSATLRRDGADKFFPGNKYALFPSMSVAWKISNENFLKDISWINLLKLRASWGKTGQDNLGSSLYATYAPNRFKVNFSDNTIVNIPYVSIGPNYPDVSWQKTSMRNIGADFYLLHNRISGSIDFFRNDITRLLGYASNSPLAIYGSRPINGGHYYRKGWEIALNTQNLTGAISWNTQLTLSQTKAYWKQRLPNYDYQTYQKRNHEPMDAYYFYNVTGIINSDRSNMPESQKTLQAEAQLPGCPIIEDRNRDGKIDEKDVCMRDNSPDLYVGFNHTFTYKNFELSFFMYGQFGIQKYNIAYSAAQAGPLAIDYPENTNRFAYRLWNSQTNPTGSRPGLAFNKMGALPGNAWVNVDIENASFLRMSNITLAYNLNGNILGSLQKYICNIRVYTDIQNPFILTKFKGFDPEIYTGGGGADGASRGEYPQTRSLSFGASVTF